MGRTLRSAKQAGATFETQIANYLADQVDDKIERRRLQGSNDRGDIAGLRVYNERLVVECKNYGGRLNVSEWLKETETERQNDNALAGFVVAKRKGTTEPGEQTVIMTLANLVTILNGRQND